MPFGKSAGITAPWLVPMHFAKLRNESLFFSVEKVKLALFVVWQLLQIKNADSYSPLRLGKTHHSE
jgi:hypothetical protein